MPTMAAITVKNAANADVIFDAAVPSAGDKTPARWVATLSNAIAGFRANFSVGTKNNGSQNARIMEFNGAVPVTNTVSGIQTLAGKMSMQVFVTLPTNVDANSVSDGYVQLSNALVSTLIRQVASTGYAPT